MDKRRCRVRAYPLVFGVIAILAAGCASRAVRQPAGAGGTDLQRLEELEPGVYRGSYVDAEADFALLESLHIHSIISLRGTPTNVHTEREAATRHGIRFFDSPMEALPFQPKESSVYTALDDIGNPANQPSFFHCKLGRDRTGMVAALYRVLYEGWSSADAHKEWEKYGFRDPFIFSGLEHFFDSHQDPSYYWRRNPVLAGLPGFSAEQSCATYANARGGKESVCAIDGGSITATTLLRVVSVGLESQAGSALFSTGGDAQPLDWAYCGRAGGQQEDLHGEQGRRIDVCRFADGSAADLAALSEAHIPKSALSLHLSAWKAH